MLIIVGLVLAAGVLWLWLIANWFGRVLAFLLFGGISVITIGEILTGAFGGERTAAIIAVLLSLIVGWCIASIPMWVAQSKERRYHEELARNVATY